MAENPVGNLLVRLDFDGSRFERGITAAKRELASYGKAVDSSNKFAKEQNYSIKSTNDALHNMRVRYQGLSGALKQTQSIMGKLDAEGKRGTDQWARRNVEMQDYQRQMYYLNEEYKKMQEQSYLANSGFTKLGNGLERTSQMMKAVGGAFQEVGGAITQVGAVATAGGALFVKQAMDFEKGMIAVQKTTNASAEQMGVFTEGIRGLAREMPIAHGELAELASIAGQLGVAQDDLLGFTETMAKVGTATSLSASEASEAFARFTNITGTGVTTIDNLASALVHLGNSYATTETEIMNLATMLVGTLSSLGVSESQILGLSAAMSSLGITAERGGSSLSKFFSQMASAASEGGDALQDFADVAGVTGEAFATMFETDPMSALQAFIDGMVRLEGEGQSFVKTLDDMGITEVRLRDTLLRLAGGHEILNSALVDSASAYGEATALQQEYDLMMQSTAAQWEVAKNKMVDVAIEIGGHLLPVIIDLLNQSDGLISMAQDVAQWFGNLDDSVKRNIVSWGAMAVPIGAVLTGFGSLVSAGGSVVGLLGNISKGVAELSVSLLRSLGYFKNIDGSATTVLTTMLKLNPAILGIVGGLALVGGGIWVWNEMTKDIREAKQAVEDFPSIEGITADQAASLREVADEVANINVEMGLLNEGADLSNLGANIQGLGDEISKINLDKINTIKERFARLPVEVQEIFQETTDATIAGLEGQLTRVEQITNRMNEIITNAGEDMTKNQIAEIQGLTSEMMSIYARSITDTAKQAEEVYRLLIADISELDGEMLTARKDANSRMLREEGERYQQELTDLRQHLDDVGATTEEALEAETIVWRNHQTRMKGIMEDLVNVTMREAELMAEAMGVSFEKGSGHYEEALADVMALTGMTREEIEAIWEAPYDNPFAEMSDEGTAALNKLLQAVNELEAEVGNIDASNIDEFKQKLIDAGISWEELEFLAKEADIDEDLKGFAQQIMETSSQWDFMTLEDKQAKIETEGEEALKELLNTLGVDWNEFEAKVQELSVDYQGGELIEEAVHALVDWNTLTLEQKLAIVETQLNNDELMTSIRGLEEWQLIELTNKFAQLDTNAPEAQEEIIALLDSWGLLQGVDTASLFTTTNAPDTLSSVGALATYWLTNMIFGLGTANAETTTNAGETQQEVEGAKGSVDELNSTTAHVGTSTDAPVEVEEPVRGAIGATEELDSTTANVKTSTDADTNVTDKANKAKQAVGNLDRSSASPTAKLVDYATATIQTVRNRLWSLDGYTANTYVYTHYKATGSFTRRKHGTPYHQGGMAILGDGGRHEPYLTPQGYFGVSPNFDTPVDLPMGSKVWSSINKFKQEAMGNDLLRPLVDQIPSLSANLPKYATGTDKSFLDELTKMRVPKENNVMNSQEQSSGDVYNFNIELQAIGTKLTSSQADGIIEPIIKSAERYGKKKGIKVNVGRS